MFAILTLDLGISPDYVLDQMQTYEVTALIEHRNHKHRERWEQTRFLAYIIAQCNSKKRLKLEDILKFDWDGKSGGTDEAPTKKDVERLAQMAKQMESLFAEQNENNTNTI